MKFKQYAAMLIAIALIVVAYGIVQTTNKPVPVPARARRFPANRAINIDQTSLIVAEQLVRMQTTPDERQFAEDALRLADQEMDLAFAQAVRQIANRKPSTSDTAKEADARLKQSVRALTADAAEVARLTAALAKADAAGALSLTDRLNLAKAQTALDQDESDDARQDLRRAGGDPQGQMQDMIDAHDSASKSSDSIRIVVTSPSRTPGLVQMVQAWQSLHRKALLVRRAQAVADSLATVFTRRHDRVEARAQARLRDSAVALLTHDSSAALLAATQRQARDEKTRAAFDQRIDNQRSLVATYAGWDGVLAAQQAGVLNRALRAVAIILLILLIGTLSAGRIEHLLGQRSVDYRRTQTMYMVARVSLQVLAVLLILLVIFGPPDNLGTFLGLAGAGLTVALKDFIVGFIGWFVLMGKDGIRMGDLVEINGVTGEVVEVGMFHTVLLETGGWTESGHPTGRRVTFTNSFAIEGHYFNFSTSGKWLWDEVEIVVPAGRDPYPVAEALQKQAEEATAQNAREAEEQWRAARRSPQGTAPTAGASVNLKPIAGGVEITVRYITRPGEREALRSTLYHTAVDLLGGRPPSSTAVPVPG